MNVFVIVVIVIVIVIVVATTASYTYISSSHLIWLLGSSTLVTNYMPLPFSLQWAANIDSGYAIAAVAAALVITRPVAAANLAAAILA